MSLYSNNLLTHEHSDLSGRDSGAWHSDGTEGNLTHQERAESSLLRENLGKIGAGTDLLQVAEDSLNAVIDNLIQMKQLVSHILSGFCDDGLKAEIKEEFDKLCSQNQKIAETAAYGDTLLYHNCQTFELYSEDQTSLLWTSEPLPTINTEILTAPDEVLQSIENVLGSISAYRSGLYSLMTALRQCSDALYSKAEVLLKSNTPVNTSSAAKTIAYRTAAQILQTDCTVPAGRSTSVSAIAGLYLGPK